MDQSKEQHTHTPSEQEVRVTALNFALSASPHVGALPEDLIKMARQFKQFLTSEDPVIDLNMKFRSKEEELTEEYCDGVSEEDVMGIVIPFTDYEFGGGHSD